RAVLHQCVARGDSARGLDIAASMKYYWITHGTTESLRWLDQLLGSGEASPRTLVRAYYLRGWLSLLQADPPAARPWIARAIATARETGQPAPLSESLSIAATVENLAGGHEAGSRYREEAEAIPPGLAQYYGLAAAGWYAANTGQTRAAAQLLGAADALGTQTGADIMGPLVPLLAQAKESAKGALGSSKFQAEFQAGSRLSRMAALRL